ncbi:MAG: hypothetical protein RLZZ626_696 [Actinomycetota bacterium]|jgi:ribosome-associated protein
MIDIAVEAAYDKLGENPVALDVSKYYALSDAFLLVSGRNERQVQSIAEEIEDKFRDAGYRLVLKEGQQLGRWILLDYGDVLIHVMHEQERMFYSLERLWADCPVLKVPAASAASL